MKSQPIAVMMLLLGLPVVASQDAPDAPLVLRLEAGQSTTTLVDPVACRLIIRGAGVSSITASVPDGTVQSRASIVKDPAFVYAFDFTPSRVGTTTLGPFRLTFQGRELVSNALVIEVLPAPEDANLLRVFPSASSIRLGESFEVTVIQRGTLADKTLDLKSILSAKTGVVRSVTTISKEERKTVSTYRITPTVAGRVVLNASSFTGLPEETTVPEVTIEVLP